MRLMQFGIFVRVWLPHAYCCYCCYRRRRHCFFFSDFFSVLFCYWNDLWHFASRACDRKFSQNRQQRNNDNKAKKGCICISCGNRTTVSVICCWGQRSNTIYDGRVTWPFPIQLQNFNQNQWRHCSEHHQPLSILHIQSTINFNFNQDHTSILHFGLLSLAVLCSSSRHN